MQDISSETILKAAQGDLDSFEQIYQILSRFVYNIAVRIVGSREDAEDVTQEVFLTVFRKLKDFRFQSSLKTWVYRIAVNCALSHAQKIAKKGKKTMSYDEHPQVVESLASEAKILTPPVVTEDLIAHLLDILNPDQRACVVLRNMQGLSYEEIAQTLKININTVRSRLKRAREAMLAWARKHDKDGAADDGKGA